MRTFARAPLLLISLVFVWLNFNGSRPVSAQTPTPIPQNSQGIPPGGSPNVTAIPLTPVMVFVIVLVLLLLAIFVLEWLFRYLKESRQDYYQTIREFGRRGVYFNPILVSATAPSAGLEAVGDAQQPDTFELAGPGTIVAGKEATFKALRNGAAADGTTWTVNLPDGSPAPPDSATLSQTTGPSVSLTAKPGVYVLVATQPGPPQLIVRTAITVETASTDGPKALPDLPFIGQGFGSIVGAIIVVAALVVLAVTSAIPSDVVGVILGALTGYLFGVGVTQQRQ